MRMYFNMWKLQLADIKKEPYRILLILLLFLLFTARQNLIELCEHTICLEVDDQLAYGNVIK